METKKRVVWSDDEVKNLIDVIKEKNIMGLLDGKSKRNRSVFEIVAKKMSENGYEKNVGQIRDKFKNMKKDYFKVKRSNGKKANQRHTAQYFNLLDDLLAHRLSASTVNMNTSFKNFVDDSMETSNYDTSADEEDPLISEVKKTSKPTKLKELPTTPQFSSFDLSELKGKQTPEHNSYQKVISQMIEEWKSTRQIMIRMMKEQDEKLLKFMNMQMKREREILKENRIEIAKLMRKDRQEILGMFNTLLETIEQQQQQPSMQQYAILDPLENNA